jgi:Fe2+ or Zn2+ uptake regulation protein
MRLLEDFDDNGFIYERGSIVLKGYFFQETHQTGTHVHFQDYQSDVTSCQYSHLVCEACIKLIEVQSKKKKVKKWKMSKVNHGRIIEDGIPLRGF